MTQHYVGTKIVVAWEQEKDGKPGYAVKYHDGYTSWSPKEVFEGAYLALGNLDDYPDYVQRMHGELVELDNRLEKLTNFLSTEVFASLPEDERRLLDAQAEGMRCYYNALSTRVSRAG